RTIDRFEICGRLGAGAMGVVFEAYDREREQKVALKTLPNADAMALYRFKKEFRTLADISHPNLVNLYELFIEPEHCFFTMEKVDGANFLAHVRPESELGDLETMAGSGSALPEPRDAGARAQVTARGAAEDTSQSEAPLLPPAPGSLDFTDDATLFPGAPALDAPPTRPGGALGSSVDRARPTGPAAADTGRAPAYAGPIAFHRLPAPRRTP